KKYCLFWSAPYFSDFQKKRPSWKLLLRFPLKLRKTLWSYFPCRYLLSRQYLFLNDFVLWLQCQIPRRPKIRYRLSPPKIRYPSLRQCLCLSQRNRYRPYFRNPPYLPYPRKKIVLSCCSPPKSQFPHRIPRKRKTLTNRSDPLSSDLL